MNIQTETFTVEQNTTLSLRWFYLIISGLTFDPHFYFWDFLQYLPRCDEAASYKSLCVTASTCAAAGEEIIPKLRFKIASKKPLIKAAFAFLVFNALRLWISQSSAPRYSNKNVSLRPGSKEMFWLLYPGHGRRRNRGPWKGVLWDLPPPPPLSSLSESGGPCHWLFLVPDLLDSLGSDHIWHWGDVYASGGAATTKILRIFHSESTRRPGCLTPPSSPALQSWEREAVLMPITPAWLRPADCTTAAVITLCFRRSSMGLFVAVISKRAVEVTAELSLLVGLAKKTSCAIGSLAPFLFLLGL